MSGQRHFCFLFYANYGFIPVERNTILIGKSSYAAFHIHFFPMQQAYNVGTEFQISLIMAFKGKGTYSNFHPLPPMSTDILRFLDLSLWDFIYGVLDLSLWVLIFSICNVKLTILGSNSLIYLSWNLFRIQSPEERKHTHLKKRLPATIQHCRCLQKNPNNLGITIKEEACSMVDILFYLLALNSPIPVSSKVKKGELQWIYPLHDFYC